ncbi:tetratricopeptide repeat protein [Pedobacter sp. UC225_61]|uniref:tetratricopeptide repeat protein n=1 Tax=Pedobacter sp. UC225_61 TaxID=3374623 RepID=UPI00378A69DC
MTNHQQMKVHGLRAAIFGAIKNQAVSVPKKSVYLEVREKMLADINKGLAYYNQLKAMAQDTYDYSFELGDLLSSGKFLQRRKHFDDAIRLFEIAVKLEGRPSDISYGYELMADTYFKKGDRASALKFYAKALETDEANKNARGMLDTLKGTSG